MEETQTIIIEHRWSEGLLTTETILEVPKSWSATHIREMFDNFNKEHGFVFDEPQKIREAYSDPAMVCVFFSDKHKALTAFINHLIKERYATEVEYSVLTF